jgi:two-component system, chemotaxis family, protein-glutamate methylesterase/glutaminase
MRRPIRVLIVDDSALVRQLLAQGLAADPELEVVGTAVDAYQARDRILALNPDVLTLDVEMPRMSGVEFLRRLMPQHPLPVVMVSSLTQRGAQVTMEALEAGAVDFVAKPSAHLGLGLVDILGELRSKIKTAATVDVSAWKGRSGLQRPTPYVRPAPLPAAAADRLIAIGASTGGTEAIRQLLENLPATMPGILIVQHMPAGFTAMYAERLNRLCALEVKEAVHGDQVRPGRALLAAGGQHMRLARSGSGFEVHCTAGEKVSGHCPSVDVLMQSVASLAGAKAIGLVLTGMGADGAEGLCAMRRAGARTLAQDQATSVVFGMPRVAFERGGAERLVPIDQMAAATLRLLEERPA